VTTWNPDASGQTPRVFAVAAFGERIYVGGQFTQIGGEFRNRLASLRTSNGQATAWNPDANGIVRSIAVTPNAIFVGGDFSSIGGSTQSYFSVFSNQPEFNSSAIEFVGDEMRVPLRTGEGQRVVVQFSSDLKQWQELTAVNAGATIEIKDPGARQHPSRFYRALLETAP
jgi:hypothetical protein